MLIIMQNGIVQNEIVGLLCLFLLGLGRTKKAAERLHSLGTDLGQAFVAQRLRRWNLDLFGRSFVGHHLRWLRGYRFGSSGNGLGRYSQDLIVRQATIVLE